MPVSLFLGNFFLSCLAQLLDTDLLRTSHGQAMFGESRGRTVAPALRGAVMQRGARVWPLQVQKHLRVCSPTAAEGEDCVLGAPEGGGDLTRCPVRGACRGLGSLQRPTAGPHTTQRATRTLITVFAQVPSPRLR